MTPSEALGQFFSALGSLVHAALTDPVAVPLLAAATALATAAAAIAAAFSARGAVATARMMRRDQELRQRPVVFVDRTEPQILQIVQPRMPTIQTGLDSRFYVRNGSQRAARVDLHAAYTLSDDGATSPPRTLHEHTNEYVVFAGQEIYVDRVFEADLLAPFRQGRLRLHIRLNYRALDSRSDEPGYFSDVVLQLALAGDGTCSYRFVSADAS